MASNKSKALLLISVILLTGITTVTIYVIDQNNADVRIGYLDGDLHHLAFYVAQENGFYEKEGLNITKYSFANGGDVMTSFAASNRSIDMAYFGFAPALYHRFNNPAADITILAGVNVNGSALIVKNISSIQDGSDLEGLKIAVPARNNMQDFILRMILNNSGVAYDEEKIIPGMSPSDMVIALQGGSIDGYVAWEPHCIKGTANDVGKYLYKSSDVWAEHPCCIIASHNDFLDSDPRIVKKVLKVHKEATDWILNHWDAAKAIAMDKMNLSEEQATVAMANIGYVYDMDLAQMVLFVEKLVDLNPGISMNSPNIPSGLNASSFIDWFVDSTMIDAL